MQLFQITDYWAPSKKAAMDPLFPDKVRAVNIEDESFQDKLPILECYFTNQPEWDPLGAGKNLPAAEVLSRYVNTIQEYFAQQVVRSLPLEFFRFNAIIQYYLHWNTFILRDVYLYFLQKIKPLLESLTQKQENLTVKEHSLHELQSALEADEQELEMLQDEIEKIEQEKTQLSQDKETCRQKLERGNKLLGIPKLRDELLPHIIS